MPNRWWIYQQERFPIFKHGLLIAVFSCAGVSYSLLLRRGFESRSLPQFLALALLAFLTLFLFFLQLRIADEFKDFYEDARFRAYRPVPRGLVTLRELGIVGIASGVIQLGLALSMSLSLAMLLVLVWGYLGLMSKEFFVPGWLKAHPLVYMLTHVLIMPLMALYASACDWLIAGVSPPSGLIWFLLISLFSGLAIEIGRKIRAPKDEERGVETYSALWGRNRAVMAWLGVVWLMALATLAAAWQIDYVAPIALIVMLLLLSSAGVAWRFLARPPLAVWARRFELMSGLWTLLVYLNLGVIPLGLRFWG
jgi:hypothetical protein